MSYLRYAARMYNTPLLITSDKARVLEQVIRAHEEGRASLLAPAAAPAAPRRELTAPGVTRAEAGYMRTANGIAIIQVIGTLVQRSADEELDAFSGLVAYSTIAGQVQAAVDDPRVDAILLEVDSQGGEAAGLMDAAAKIRVAAGKKPVWAIANELALSAGYWAASAATKLFAAQTGMVGSIGVRMLHVDQSQRDAKQGLVYTEIASHGRKTDFTSHAPLGDPAKAFAQENVDQLAAMFVGAVAEYRNVDPTAVDGTDAALLSPQNALELDLIDGIQSFDETLAQLAAEAQYVRTHGMRAPARTSQRSANADKEQAMNDQDKAAQAALIAEARAAGLAEGKTAGEAESAKKLAEAQAAAATAAQARVAAILGHEEAKGRTKAAQHIAFNTSMTVEEAVKMLASTEKESAPAANLLADLMARVENQNPKVGADGKPLDEKTVTAPVAANIYAFRRECVAKARAGAK